MSAKQLQEQYMWPDGIHLNRDIVARPATVIAENAGLTVPDDTRFLMVVGEKSARKTVFQGKKSPLFSRSGNGRTIDEMLDRLEKILKFSGKAIRCPAL